MEAIVTVEFRFAHGFKYTSQHRGMETTVVPAFGVPLWYASFKDREGVGTTLLDQSNEETIVDSLLKGGYKPLFMKWCMEESRSYGFNPFVGDTQRLNSRPNLVYITHDLDDDLIKVGTSGNLKKRLQILYSRKGHKFKMLGLMQGSFNTEHAVCQHFKEHLVMGREWFRPHQDIFDFVETHAFHPGDAVKP